MISKVYHIKDIFNAQGKDVIKICGISRQGLDYLNKETDIPRNKNSLYNLVYLIPWMIQYKSEQALKENARLGDDDPKKIEQIRKLKNQNEKLELEIAKLQKSVIPREEVISTFQNNVSELLHFLTLGYKKNGPKILSKLGIGGDKLDHFFLIMDEFVKEAMEAFSKEGKDWEPFSKEGEEEDG